MRPVTHLPTCATETAGAGGLKIAETFPEGRGSPHGCGLRAVFCRDAASARPAACRDKSKVPRSGDFAGRSPGVQGAAATGRPLCAPCAIRDITQKINRERNLPGINIEVVALPNIVRTGTFPVGPPFRRVAATPYPARGSCGLSLIYPFARLKLPVLAASKSLRRSRKAGAARMDAG
ncbi:hypothetical protein DQB71_13235 [Klebsiella pneumoniae subsp. pneumoniae]|nr:hypothetical protein DQB71_13235 [Klebsiella pneumoniae subsp. pneumoniae]